jgi:branched-chain amino acid transport system substrate-binding protein
MNRKFRAVAVAGLLVLAGCSEPESDGAGGAGGSKTDISVPGAEGKGGDTIRARFGGGKWFLGTLPETPTAADKGAEPIRIGMINQEDTPLGSYPELRRAVEAGVEFINAELGGVDGRPLELHTCITSFSPEMSAGCAQEMAQKGVVAMVGGIDVTSTGSMPVLEQNGIPQLGGIPANSVEQKSDIAFFFSGGVSGGMAAFLKDVADKGGKKVVLAYGEFEAFESAAQDHAKPLAAALGLELEMVPYPVVSTDFVPVATRALDYDPDAVIVAAAGTSCAPIMKTMVDLKSPAQLYLVGACSDPQIITAAGGAHKGGASGKPVLFNSEGPPTSVETIENDLFNAINEIYADLEGGASGTISLRGLLNLYSILLEIGPDDVSSERILEVVRAAEGRTSFWGHDFTCDGKQVEGYPALCAPQQTLFRVGEPGENLVVSKEWFDVVALLRGDVG